MKGGQLIYKLGLLIAIIISSFYLLMLGRYNIPALDDYGYIAMVEEDGLLELISTTYNGWQCRFSTFFVNGLFWLAFGRANNLIWVTIIMLLSGWWVTGQLLMGILRRYIVACCSADRKCWRIILFGTSYVLLAVCFELYHFDLDDHASGVCSVLL